MTEIEIAHKDYIKKMHLRLTMLAAFFIPFFYLTDLAKINELVTISIGAFINLLLGFWLQRSEKKFVFIFVSSFMLTNLCFWIAAFLNFSPAMIYLALLSGICMLAALSETTKRSLLIFATYLVVMCLPLIAFNYALVISAVMSILWIAHNTLKTIELQKELMEKSALSTQSKLMMDSYRYLAHHINNSLTVIKGHCELIRWKAETIDDSQLLKSTSRIFSSGKRMEKIVQVFKTLNSGELKNIPSESDIQKLIRDKDKDNESSDVN